MNNTSKRSVGNRIEKPITFKALGDSLVAGANFNTEIHKTFGITCTGIPKGVYRFTDHASANKHQEECLAKYMVAVEAAHYARRQNTI